MGGKPIPLPPSPHPKPLISLNKTAYWGVGGGKNRGGRERGLDKGKSNRVCYNLKKGKRVFPPPTSPQYNDEYKNKIYNYIIIKDNIYIYIIQIRGD